MSEPSSGPTFLGIDPSSRRPPFYYAALDENLRLLALGNGRLGDVLAFAAGQSRVLAAINAPAQPGRGHPGAEGERQLSLEGQPVGWGKPVSRGVERLLIQRGLPVYHTPGDAASAPAWMRRGFALYQRLHELGYRPFPYSEASRQWMEVPAEAAFVSLLGQALLPAQRLEGRWQRQLILADLQVQVEDPMRFFEEITRHRLRKGQLPMHLIYAPGELNALVAAYTAWLQVNHPERVLRLGDEDEGQVFIPMAEGSQG